MTTDFRALCAELAEKLDDLHCHYNVPNQAALITRTRAALADEPAAPAPPADGDVAEFVAQLRRYAETGTPLRLVPFLLTRAAELLQQQALVPVSVRERPWEREGWCDELKRCWWGRGESDDWSADWTLATPEAIAEFCEFSPQTVCLPAHALPLPELGE